MQTSHNFETDHTDAWNEVFDPEGELDETAAALFDCSYTPARYSDECSEASATMVALRIKHRSGVRYLSREQAVNIFGPRYIIRIEDDAMEGYVSRQRRDAIDRAYDRARDDEAPHAASCPA
jgi:hypothetical protein